ncbi:MAG: VCBS repeat-containing protein, partial [Gemmataceae bacterium]|nr:VCBS repeat-containing protein [Gemmataceae bacterium]
MSTKLHRSLRAGAVKRWVAVLLLLAGTGGAAGLWFLSVTGSATKEMPEPTWFADVTDQLGIDFIHDAGDLSKFLTPQIHGSGVALFDCDSDGRLDIYLLTHGGCRSTSTNRLFQNRGDGTFRDVTANSGLGIAGDNTGVIVGDVNNDGRPDVVVLQFGGVKLFVNEGHGVFRDVTQAAGLDNPLWATSANFLDFDRDGWLDLVV